MPTKSNSFSCPLSLGDPPGIVRAGPAVSFGRLRMDHFRLSLVRVGPALSFGWLRGNHWLLSLVRAAPALSVGWLRSDI